MNSSHAAHPETAPEILLVDDNNLGLVARKMLLQERGYTIATATSGEEALALFSGSRFDLVVTDFRMDRMDGIELIRRLREFAPHIRIILLSGFVEALGLNEQSTGADVVISKSAGEVPHLLRSVDRLMSRRPVRKASTSHRGALHAKARSV